MGTFVVDTSKDTLLKVCDRNLRCTRDHHNADKYNHFTKEEKERNLQQTYSYYLIDGTILLIEQEIIRHTIFEKMNYVHFFFKDKEQQKEYVERYQSFYPYYRKEVKSIMGDYFNDLYKEEKRSNNNRILKELEESDWKTTYGIKCYLPFFYKDGTFRPIKKEQYDYNSNWKYNGEN